MCEKPEWIEVPGIGDLNVESKNELNDGRICYECDSYITGVKCSFYILTWQHGGYDVYDRNGDGFLPSLVSNDDRITEHYENSKTPEYLTCEVVSFVESRKSVLLFSQEFNIDNLKRSARISRTLSGDYIVQRNSIEMYKGPIRERAIDAYNSVVDAYSMGNKNESNGRTEENHKHDT